METLFTGIIMGFSLAAPIGPVNIETIKRGFKSGLKPAIMFGTGAIFGDVFYCTLLLIGLVPLIASIPGLHKFLWGAGALIMTYLGWGGIKEFWQKKEFDMEEVREQQGAINNFTLGWVMAVFNPYAFMWHITAGGAFISAGVSKAGFLGGITSIGSFLVGVSMWLALLVFGIRKARPLITPVTMRMISGFSGVALWGFAVWFAANFAGV